MLISTAVRILIGWLLIDRVPAWLYRKDNQSNWCADYYQCVISLGVGKAKKRNISVTFYSCHTLRRKCKNVYEEILLCCCCNCVGDRL